MKKPLRRACAILGSTWTHPASAAERPNLRFVLSVPTTRVTTLARELIPRNQERVTS
ncbi:MAG TPA: hypothetical protein PKM73_06745 [Verrucomicrobiota bacterium]|nr:hypothetical protein [Verrucomicrobiota bacterium]